jgi:hypothetical protein
MYTEELVQEWLQVYDNLTSFSFMAYFYLREEEIHLLSKGLVARLMLINEDHKFAVIHDEVNEETARALSTYQGMSLSFIFPGKASDHENLVSTTILEGLEFLRIKGDYLGVTEVADYV